MKLRLALAVIAVCSLGLASEAAAQGGEPQAAKPRLPAIALAAKPSSLDRDSEREFEFNRDFLPFTALRDAADQPLAPTIEPFDAGPVSFAIASSAQFVETQHGSLQETGAEVRFGQRLKEALGAYTPGAKPSWYVFAGGGGQAITYTPGVSASLTEGGNLALQDRVRVGRMQAGVAIQHKGVHAALAYVRKEVNIGQLREEAIQRQQHFAGVSVSFRH